MDLNEIVAENIRIVRAIRGFSRRQLSELTANAGNKISLGSIGRLERNEQEITVGDLEVLSKVYGIPAPAFLTVALGGI